MGRARFQRTENKPAIKTYEAIGFELTKELNCYTGAINNNSSKTAFEIRELEKHDWHLLRSFWDWIPSWQNSITSIENSKNKHIRIGIYDKEALTGYLIYNPETNRIQQFSVSKKHRRQGLGRQLFEYIAQTTNKNFSLINVDNNSKETAGFLLSLGFQSFIKQYEMELKIG